MVTSRFCPSALSGCCRHYEGSLLEHRRLELESPETAALNCRRFEVNAAEEVRIARHELRVRTETDIPMDGGTIRLNCEEAR